MRRRFRSSPWRAPLLVALASLSGLVCALLGDGVYDALAWVALLVPVVFIVYSFRQGNS